MNIIAAPSALTSASNVPAKREPVNQWAMIDRLTSDADDLVDQYAELRKRSNELRGYRNDLINHGYAGGQLPDLSDPKPDDEEKERIAGCKAILETIDPEEIYNSDGNLKKSVVSKRLALMMGAFPSGQPANPEVFTRMLLEHIAHDEELSCLLLECVCREIESSKKFLPSVSEVRAVIEEQKHQWDKRIFAIHGIEREARDLAKAIDALKPRILAAQAERAEKEATMALQLAFTMRNNTAKHIAEQQEQAAQLAQKIEANFDKLAEREDTIAAATATLAEATAKKEQLTDENEVAKSVTKPTSAPTAT